jgi:hypothetical protein
VTETFRPRSNYVWAGAAFILILLFAANSFVVSSSTPQTLLELMFCGILGITAYLIWVRPKLVLGKDGVQVVNPIKTELISYSDILELETKWALTIVHPRGKTSVWVAPASGKRRWIADKTFGFYGSGVPMSESKSNDSQAMSASLNSLSGQAAYLIRERIKRLH